MGIFGAAKKGFGMLGKSMAKHRMLRGTSTRADRIKHGGRIKKQTGGRTNLLEELGRVEAEPSNPNRRAEISRVHGELNRGYKTGGRIGFKKGGFSIKTKKVKPGFDQEFTLPK